MGMAFGSSSLTVLSFKPKDEVMIQVERLNGEVIFVNPDLIRTVSAKPDTVLTFIDGSTLAILEKTESFLKKWTEHRSKKDVSWK
jgi:uncharacterized protein YlzI (FlbEa/FlbD family)